MASLEEELGRLGARVSPQWLASCLAFLQGSQPGLAAAPAPARAKAVLQQLLATDLNQCGAPALPPGVQGLHDTTLPGKLLLQVDEVVNIAAAVRERYSGNDGGQRCLKLLLTDGVQQVAAVEYHPTPALHSAMPAGCKLVVQGAAVRRGMLLLTPQCCAVLGGGVARLEDARRRMVAHWTQPAVGRRGPPPTMAQATVEATRAAWAGGPAPGGAGGRPSQQQLLQGPAVNPQQQQQLQQPVAVRPPPMQQPQAVQRPSQQATQLLSQQVQRQQPAVQHGVGPGSGRTQPAAPGRPQPPLQQHQHQQPHRPEVQRPPPQQHQQQNYPPQNLGGGAASGRAAAGPAPLQQHNGDAAPSGGAKRSRLALAKAPTQAPSEPAAADFGFAQPPQHQPGVQQGGPARGRLAAPNQLAQRLRQAGGGLAAGGAGAAAAAAAGAMHGAGTDDDPICLDDPDEQQQPQPGSSGAAEPSGDVAMAAAHEPAGWDGDDGWEEDQAALGGPHLDPWEQGYEAAEDEEQLPDADQPDGGGWQDGEDWQADDGWQDGEDAMEEDPAAGTIEQQEGQGHGAAAAAAAAADDEGSWDDGVDAAEGAAPPAAPPAGAGNAAAGAAVRQPAGKRRSSGSAVEVPRQSSRRQQHNASDGASHPGRPAKQQQLQQQSPVQPAQQQGKVPAAAVTPVGDASTISSTLGLADLTVQQASDRAHQAPRVPAAAAQQSEQQQQQQQQQQPEQQLASPAARLRGLAVPQLEALSPSLLGAAPTLAEVLYSKPAAAAVEAAPPAAAVAVGSSSSGRAVPSVPALRGAPQRPTLASGRGPLRLLSVSAPSAAAAAARPAAAASRPAAAAAAPAVSDDDMPSFALLDDMSPVRAQQGAAPAAAVAAEDEPFIYLLELHRRAASAGPESFPLAARIFGTIRGINGKLGFTNPHTGQPEYTMNLEIEDGSLLVPARLGTQFMREFFDVEPQEFQALLADPTRKLEGVELAKGLQKLLSSYSGLIEVELEAPGRPLLVRNIGQELRGEEVAALQRRAAGG